MNYRDARKVTGSIPSGEDLSWLSSVTPLELFLYIRKLEKRIKQLEGITAYLHTEIKALRGPSGDWMTQYRYQLKDPNDPDSWEPVRE